MTDSVSNEGLKAGRRAAPAGRQRSQGGAPDRLPPHAGEAEQGVLSCILMAPKECLAECVTKFKGNRVFYDLRHQTIYDAAVTMWNELKPIDLITLQQWLKDQQQLEDAGGIAYLSELPDVAPSAANLGYYAEIVFEKFLLRQTLQVCGECMTRVWEFEGDVEELLDSVERDILKVGEARVTTELRTMHELMKRNVALVEDMHRGVGIIGGVRTRFGYFDKLTGGLHPKELIIIAGRPSLGKTSLAMGIAHNVAKIEQKPVGVFSLEMGAEDLSLRLWCSESSVNFHKLRTGFAAERDIVALTTTVVKVSKWPIYIDDTASLSILELRARARRMVHQFGCQLFVVDYLQLMRSTNKRAQNREQEISDISSGLKAMAKELSVPVVALAQLNREAEKRKYAKPQSSDLRESGAIEQDADFIGILYRPKVEGQDDEDAEEIRTNLYVTKQRNGPTGDVEFLFKRWCMRFEDAYGNTGHAAPAAGAGLSKIADDVVAAMGAGPSSKFQVPNATQEELPG